MTEITTRDLSESLTLLTPQRQSDKEGGWHEEWQQGPRIWASICPLLGGHGFHTNAKGDPMMSQEGYIKGRPPARYRVIIRAGIDLPLKPAFLWHLYEKPTRLLVINKPIRIQYNRFVRMIAMEEKDG